MGVDAYQTNQTSRATFRAPQRAAPIKAEGRHPVKVPPLSRLPPLAWCRPLDHVPPLDWASPPVRCCPLIKFHQLFSRVDAPGNKNAIYLQKQNIFDWYDNHQRSVIINTQLH